MRGGAGWSKHWWTCAALVAALVASGANAQTLTASYGLARFRHPLIGTVGGYDLQVTWAPVGVASGALSIGRHRGSHLTTDIVCVGLIPPGANCPSEQVRNEATTTEMAGMLDVLLFKRMISGARVEGTAAIGIQGLRVESNSLGQTTGNRIHAERTRFGPILGFVMTAWPKPAVPVGLSLGIAGGMYGDTGERVEDGYAPFEEGFSVTRVELGLVVFIPR